MPQVGVTLLTNGASFYCISEPNTWVSGKSWRAQSERVVED